MWTDFYDNVDTNFDDDFDDWEDDDTETAEITYSVLGSNAPDETFEMDFSESEAYLLRVAEGEGEMLDSDYISENLEFIHDKIIEAIKEDLAFKSGDPHDGMVEKRHSWGGSHWEKVHASHQEMSMADEYEIEYTVDVF